MSSRSGASPSAPSRHSCSLSSPVLLLPQLPAAPLLFLIVAPPPSPPYFPSSLSWSILLPHLRPESTERGL
eukprot:1425089-Rhodomonas_salina.1